MRQPRLQETNADGSGSYNKSRGDLKKRSVCETYVLLSVGVRVVAEHMRLGGAEVAANAEDNHEADVGEDGELPALAALTALHLVQCLQDLVRVHIQSLTIVFVAVDGLSVAVLALGDSGDGGSCLLLCGESPTRGCLVAVLILEALSTPSSNARLCRDRRGDSAVVVCTFRTVLEVISALAFQEAKFMQLWASRCLGEDPLLPHNKF